MFFIEVISMAGLFPLSVILHFPPEVHLSRGVGDLCPLLVRALHANKISALQFLHGGPRSRHCAQALSSPPSPRMPKFTPSVMAFSRTSLTCRMEIA